MGAGTGRLNDPRRPAYLAGYWYWLGMAVPDYQSLMAPALQALTDNNEHSMSQLRTVIADKMGLSEEDLRAKIPSGAPLFASRLHWAVTYMYQSGLVRRPRRGVVEITPRYGCAS